MRRGEIRWFRFTVPDKRRPVLVLTRDSALAYMGEVTVAPLTSSIRDIPTEVVLDEADGMAKPCAVNCDHLQTVAKGQIGALITTLPPAKMRAVSQAIAFALGM